MATSESAAAGAQSGTPGSPVPRAAAVTVLAEEPSTGLFPAKPAAGAAPPPTAGDTPATVSGTRVPAAAEGDGEAEAEGKSEEKEPHRAAAEERPGTESETEERPEAETEPEAGPAAAGPAVPAAATTSTAASAESAAATATAATTGAATTGGATGTRRTGVLPMGRPGKPLIAAAVAGGLVLVGVPFLISGLSGSGDNTSTPTALAPAGSRMGPDGSGPGFVPGQQNAPGDHRQKSDGKPAAGSAAGGSGTGGSGAGGAATDALHETGTKDLPTGSTEEPRSTGGESTASGKDTESASPDAPAATEDSAAKPVAPPQKPVAAVTYSHFIGPGCDTPGFATSDQYRDGLKGWVGSTGSQTSYGCSGFYYSVPLSNSTTTSTGYAQWKFPTGSVTNGTCQVSVYIPNVKDISRVGGNPAHYAVHRYFQAKPSTQISTFDIDQPSHLGQWINAGTFPVSTGKISIVLENRGKTSGNRHAAAAPIKVNCTAS